MGEVQHDVQRRTWVSLYIFLVQNVCLFLCQQRAFRFHAAVRFKSSESLEDPYLRDARDRLLWQPDALQVSEACWVQSEGMWAVTVLLARCYLAFGCMDLALPPHELLCLPWRGLLHDSHGETSAHYAAT